MLKDRKLLAAAVSIACNCLLVIIKLAGARLSLSAAMKADALHSASDILISGLVFLSICFTLRRERDQLEDDPNRGRTVDRKGETSEDAVDTSSRIVVENLTALLVSMLLIGAAIGFLVRAFTGYTYSLERIPIAAAIVWVCILVSYFLGQYKIRVGREERSISLEADGQHSRMDMYSSAIVFVGLLGDSIGIRLDALASALVSFLVLKAGGEVLISSIRGLVASKAFTYQSLAGLRTTSLGQRLAPAYDCLLARHVEKLCQERVQALHYIVRKRRVIAVMLGIIVATGYLCSGLYRIQPDEVGVVLRCGKLVEQCAAPGLHYRFPSPITRLYRVKPHAVRRLEFGFRTVARRGDIVEPSAYLWESMHRTGIYKKVEPEAIMLTGDVNELDLNLVIEFYVADAAAAGFLFNLADSEAVVRAATEETVRKVVGRMQLTDILTTARPETEAAVSSGLQRLLDQYQACVTISAVRLQDVHPPVDVVPAFRRVATAREDRITSINEAEGYRNWTIPRSRGFASQILADGDAYKSEKSNNAVGDAAYFAQVHDAFREAPYVVALTMYFERLEESLPALRKVVLGDDVSSETSENTLQRFFMIGEFLKEGLNTNQ